jgi:plastocyanin
MKIKGIFTGIFLLFFLVITVNSCSKSSDPVPVNNNPVVTADISISGMAYSPASKTVSKGTVVKWTNNDGTPHTVTANNGSFDSGTIAAGSSYTYTASVAGTFTYYCTIHGVGMAGTLIVNP